MSVIRPLLLASGLALTAPLVLAPSSVRAQEEEGYTVWKRQGLFMLENDRQEEAVEQFLLAAATPEGSTDVELHVLIANTAQQVHRIGLAIETLERATRFATGEDLDLVERGLQELNSRFGAVIFRPENNLARAPGTLTFEGRIIDPRLRAAQQFVVEKIATDGVQEDRYYLPPGSYTLREATFTVSAGESVRVELMGIDPRPATAQAPVFLGVGFRLGLRPDLGNGNGGLAVAAPGGEIDLGIRAARFGKGSLVVLVGLRALASGASSTVGSADLSSIQVGGEAGLGVEINVNQTFNITPQLTYQATFLGAAFYDSFRLDTDSVLWSGEESAASVSHGPMLGVGLGFDITRARRVRIAVVANAGPAFLNRTGDDSGVIEDTWTRPDDTTTYPTGSAYTYLEAGITAGVRWSF